MYSSESVKKDFQQKILKKDVRTNQPDKIKNESNILVSNFVKRKNYLENQPSIIKVPVPLHSSDTYLPSCFPWLTGFIPNLSSYQRYDNQNLKKVKYSKIESCHKNVIIKKKTESQPSYLQSKTLNLKSNLNEKKQRDSLINENNDDPIFENVSKKLLESTYPTSSNSKNLLGYVKFNKNENDNCIHQLYLDLNGKSLNKVKITQLQSNSILVRFDKSCDDSSNEEIRNYNRKDCESNKISEMLMFLDHLKKFQKKQISFSNLQVIFDFYSEDSNLIIRNHVIKKFFRDFFNDLSFENSLEELSKIELLLVGVLLIKKQYKKWDQVNFSFKELQSSQTNKTKKTLFIQFLKIILKFFYKINKRSEEYLNFINEINLKNNLTSNSPNFKSFLKTITQDSENQSEEEQIKNIISDLFKNKWVHNNLNHKNVTNLKSKIFNFYFESQLNHEIMKFLHFKEKFLNVYHDTKYGLLKFFLKIFTQDKFKVGYSFYELEQLKENFLSCI